MLQLNGSNVENHVQPPSTPKFRQVISHPVRNLRVPFPLVVVADSWPCWLPSVLALQSPLAGVYMPPRMHKFFPTLPLWSHPKLMSTWSTHEDFIAYTSKSRSLPSTVCLMVSGSRPFYKILRARLQAHPGPIFYAFNTKFQNEKSHNVRRDLYRLQKMLAADNFKSVILSHSDFGGATNARHVIAFRGFDPVVFSTPECMPRVLKHLLNSAAKGFAQPIDSPVSLQGAVPRSPIVVDGLLRREGLLDLHHPRKHIAVPSVFAPSGWVRRTLTLKELLRAFDLPISMDPVFASIDSLELKNGTLPNGVDSALSPLIVTSIMRTLWGQSVGGKVDSTDAENVGVAFPDDLPQLPMEESIKNDDNAFALAPVGENINDEDVDTSILVSDKLTLTQGIDGNIEAGEVRDLENTTPKPETILFDFSLIPELVDPRDSSLSFAKPECNDSSTHVPRSLAPSQKRLDRIKREHDLAKAVKADDAEVPVHLWDERVCRAKPSTIQVAKLQVLRSFILRAYQRQVYLDCVSYLRKRYGKKWYMLPNYSKIAKKHGKERARDVHAMRDIVWRCQQNSWFEYTSGSRLFYYRYPQRYQKIARDGVPVFFFGPFPKKKRHQPKMPPAETAVLRDKLRKMILRRYLVVPEQQLRSLIYYFGVPKGVLDGIVQDWRIVYHAGANNLNDAVWAPSFWLPRVDSLLRIVDFDTVMEDRDMGEMFLNFQLDPFISQFTGVDIGPLDIDQDTCSKRWLCWDRNLMGFKSSPYNSVRMYLISEEIIRGDRHDRDNAFQWHDITLNLPGSVEYKPDATWISKRRQDGTLASDFVCFMDDQRITGAGDDRIIEAGHTLSSRESYLGIQDALRKLREGGQGAWAGAVVHVTDEHGVIVLTSQDKWDRMKMILAKWLARVEAGEELLSHPELLSDRGFLIYVTQSYPALTPYLKGIHLTLEMWRGGRDREGWKIKPDKPPSTTKDDDWELLGNEEAQEDKALLEEKTVAPPPHGPSSGLTKTVPRLLDDLKALVCLTDRDTPCFRVVRSKVVLTAYYGFGDASSGGFGATIERPDGIQGRCGLWGSDEENASSNYRELLNLVETVEEEAKGGHLRNTELWLFTDNSTAESCFARGSSSSKKLHELILRLRKVEMEAGLTLYLVHVAGTRMIDQGTDGLSRGVLLEGVLTGKDMLAYVELAKTAFERFPSLIDFIKFWTELNEPHILTPEEWFVEGHGITGGKKDGHGVWIPSHAKKYETYVWAPPPVIADVALEECLKAVHKRQDAFHIFVIPRLFTTKWRRLFAKLCDFTTVLPVGSPHWPSHMHEPLWIGISLPFLHHRPWTIRGTPALVGLDRELREVLRSGKGDGGIVLRKLLRTARGVHSVPERVACGMLRLPREGSVSHGKDSRRGR